MQLHFHSLTLFINKTETTFQQLGKKNQQIYKLKNKYLHGGMWKMLPTDSKLYQLSFLLSKQRGELYNFQLYMICKTSFKYLYDASLQYVRNWACRI